MKTKLCIIISFCFLNIQMFAQKHFEMVLTHQGKPWESDVITLADDNFLLILNHTDRDSSKVELLKINDEGDTLERRFLAIDGYQISGSAISAGNGIVLVAGLGSECNSRDPSFGFVLIEMDLSLNEKRRKLFFDENLSELPIGRLKTSRQKLFYFYWDGIYEFDNKFQYRANYPSFAHLHYRTYEMLGKKLCIKPSPPIHFS